MDRAAAELFLASLFLEPTPERESALKNAVPAAANWEGLLPALEAHGVLVLFRRNLERAGVELPAAIAPLLQSRANQLADEAQRTWLTLQRLLQVCAREPLEITLVGDSAFAFDVYPERTLRRPGTLELLVRGRHFAAALRCAEQAGLLLAESSLPARWQRSMHTSVELVPCSPLLCGVRLRARLHHPSLLLTVKQDELLQRRRSLDLEGSSVFTLDPLDRLLDLAVQLATRAGETLLAAGRRTLLAAAGSAGHPLRLSWILDLHSEVERRHAGLSVAGLVERAKEWNAEAALKASLELAHTGLGFAPEAREWVRQVTRGLAGASSSEGHGRAASALPVLFRPDPIERLPLWLRPSEAFLVRYYGLAAGASPRRLRVARARHLAGILGQGAVTLVALPIGLLARRLARNRRRAAWEEAQAPQRIGDLNDAWRAAQRVEQQKAIAPRSVSLLPQEEGVQRLPDHYRG